MEQTERLKLIKKAGPFLYTVGITVLCFYVFCRARNFLNLLTGSETGFLIFTLFALFLITMGGFSKRFLVGKNKVTTYFAGITSFLLLYAMIAVTVSDVVRFLVLQIGREHVDPDRIGLYLGWAGIAFIFIAMIYGIHHAGVIRVKRYPFRLTDTRKDYRLVLLSDLHIGYYVGTKQIGKIVCQVNDLKPDLVVIAGDLINAGNTEECPDLEQVERLLRGIRAKEGVYAVTGNHDPDRKDPSFQKFLQRSGIRLLEDEAIITEEVTLIGRNSRTEKRKSLSELMKRDAEGPFIVIDHDPMGFEEAVAEGIDYVLCGHTHKGQVFPLNLFLRALYPKNEIWGSSRTGKTNLIVSAGSGFFSMPMRIGTDSEVVLLEQKAE